MGSGDYKGLEMEGEVQGWEVSTLSVLRGWCSGQKARVWGLCSPPFQEAHCASPCFPTHLCPTPVPVSYPFICRGREDWAKCLTKGQDKNKGSDGSLHNLSEKGDKTESSVFGAGQHALP